MGNGQRRTLPPRSARPSHNIILDAIADLLIGATPPDSPRPSGSGADADLAHTRGDGGSFEERLQIMVMILVETPDGEQFLGAPQLPFHILIFRTRATFPPQTASFLIADSVWRTELYCSQEK